MKTLRRLLLPLLLSAFGFIVMHDYAMTRLDAGAQYDICCMQAAAAADLPSQIHKRIHVLLDTREEAVPLPEAVPARPRRSTAEPAPRSYISPIRTKPPLPGTFSL